MASDSSFIRKKKKVYRRDYETKYWWTRGWMMRSGFPKGEVGSIDAAMKYAAKGLIWKAQCIERQTDTVLWTVIRGAKVVGRNLYSVFAYRGNREE